MIKSSDLENRAAQSQTIRGEVRVRADMERVRGPRPRLRQLADELDAAPRLGADEDSPEGARYVQMSDTLAKRLAARLREVIGE